MSPLADLLPASKMELLRRLLRGDATAGDLAAEIGLHITVVRRHLQELVLAGLAEAIPVAGPRGRPSNRYRIAPAGREALHARYDLVLRTLVDTIAARRPPLGAQIMGDAARALAQESGAPLEEDQVLRLFDELGFVPEIERTGEGRLMLSHNCPVIAVARENPELVCDTFHCTLLGSLLGTTPRPLRQAISRGAEYCVHELEA